MADGVILLHGIFRTARSMEAMARFLRREGYDVLNLDYPSTRQTLADIANTIHPAIADFAAKHPSVHLVGYSMGGLVIRRYLAQYPLANLGRVVMIGTPNQGSEVADFVQRWWLYRKLYGPAGQELVTTLDRTELGSVTYELGIIAGNRALDPLCHAIIKQPNDGKVSVESTRLDGMKAHYVMPATHTLFPNNRRAWAQLRHFLAQGIFTNS